MGCFLIELNHYPNQCRLEIIDIHPNSFKETLQDMLKIIVIKIDFQSVFVSPRDTTIR